MTLDSQYQNLKFELPQIQHQYGENIHILQDPYLLTLLAKISHPETTQPLLTDYIKKAYLHLFNQFAATLPTQKVSLPTRMIEHHPEGTYNGEIIDQSLKFVCVDLARAGMIPSQLFYSELNYLVIPENVRQDHFYAARLVNDKGEVTGVDISGSKIGGDIDDRYVIFADPMGATGGTICESIQHYKRNVTGKARKFITAHLIITPEYIDRIQTEHPDVIVFAARLDRGLSDEKVLKSVPGTYLKQEKGLNNHQYIVPGAGGVGELLNNSFV